MARLLAQNILRGVCLLFSAFFLFGFLASFEPGVSAGWKAGYAIALVMALCGTILPWRSLRKHSKPEEASRVSGD